MAETTPDITAGPELPQVEQHLVRPTEPVVGRVVSNEPCTSGKAAGFVRHVSIDVSGTPLAGRFRAGQSFGVLAPGEDDRGRPHKPRLYSIASPTRGEDASGLEAEAVESAGSGGTIISTTVKRTIDEHWDDHRLFLGVASNYLCDTQPGDEIRVSGPAGKRFLLPDRPDEHDYVFFATGTGIAPFRAMLLDLIASPGFASSRVVIVMGAPYATDLLYDRSLRAIAERFDNVSYLPAISRESVQPDGTPGRMYVQDRIAQSADVLVPLLSSERSLVYVCGIAGMELGILRALWTQLDGDARRGLLDADADLDPADWTRRMIHRQIRPTRRVFMEVY